MVSACYDDILILTQPCLCGNKYGMFSMLMLFAGVIPEELCTLSKLRVFDVSSNNLTGECIF